MRSWSLTRELSKTVGSPLSALVYPGDGWDGVCVAFSIPHNPKPEERFRSTLSWTYEEPASKYRMVGSHPRWPGRRVYIASSKVNVSPRAICGETCERSCLGQRCQAIEPVSYGAP